MKTEFGWTGKILRVDLTERKWSVVPTEIYSSRFIGGIGIGYKIIWDEVPPDTNAFDPDNRIVFAPGPLTGTLAPTSGRFELVSKSPRSYPKETVTRSGMGGYWGPELKFAGYDGLIIWGKADRWVNLWIHNDQVEFRDAKDYMGVDTYETQIRLRKELNPKARILCIGPAGENLSRLAVILTETSFASGRSGFGAVMGSKRLKAIAVRGKKPVNVFDPERLITVSKKARMLSAGNPMREWTSRNLNDEERDVFLNRYRQKNTGCFGCPVQCFAHLRVSDDSGAACHCNSYFYFHKATKYYGSSRERDLAVSDGFLMANRLGLDMYEHKWMLDLLEDFHIDGLIQPEPDFELDKIGSREFLHQLLTGIAYRKGLGNMLTEGCARAMDHIPDGWRFASRYFPAHGSAAHGSGREQITNHPGVSLMWATDNRDPLVDHHAYLKLAVTDLKKPPPYTLSKNKAETISRNLFGSALAIDHTTFEHKPEAVVYAQDRAAVVNLLVLCDWIFPIFSSPASDGWMGDTALESQLLSAVTGCHLEQGELDQVGERVFNIARAIMIREGRGREADTLHESFFQEQNGHNAIPKVDFEQAKSRYYRLRGWDEKTGIPTQEKLSELNLNDILEGLFVS